MPSGNYAPDRDASIVTTRPTTSGPIFKPSPPDALTSGYQLDRTAFGGVAANPVPRGRFRTPVLTAGSQLALAQYGAPWPTQINSSVKQFTAHRPNIFRQIYAATISGNYGGNTSRSNFGYRHQRFPVTDTYHGSQAGYPGPVPSASRPMWDTLLAIVWALRVVNPTAGGSANGGGNPPNYNSNLYTNPAQYVPAGSASLAYKGENVA